MGIYDISVIGGGPAGCMAAITAARLGKKVILIEKNAEIGKKILITGKGRCNISNSAPVGAFIEKFGARGRFLKTAVYNFSSADLVEFFGSAGLELKTERQGRIFPSSDKAGSVTAALKKLLADAGVEIMYNSRAAGINRGTNCLVVKLSGGAAVCSKNVILCAGGASFKATGSTGDGYEMAARLGHTVMPLEPGLVPLRTEEKFVVQLQGIALKNVRISFGSGKKMLVSPIGELMFTHFGISGPLVLDLSGAVVKMAEETVVVPARIDFKPGLTPEQIDRRLLKDIKEKCNIDTGNLMKSFLPHRLVPVFLQAASVSAGKKSNQITAEERSSIRDFLKSFPLTVAGPLALEEGMVTDGGISTAEINPRTMESKLVHGLFFAGEIIDGRAPSGGYNIQQAFSTGRLAGESAAKNI